jgi:hypothetical protein
MECGWRNHRTGICDVSGVKKSEKYGVQTKNEEYIGEITLNPLALL